MIIFVFFTDQDARYVIGRMCRIGAARFGIRHFFRIAVVRNDQQLAVDGTEGFDDFADAGIDRFNGFDSCFKTPV